MHHSECLQCSWCYFAAWSADHGEIDQKIETLIGRIPEGAFVCHVCDYSYNTEQDMKKHVETFKPEVANVVAAKVDQMLKYPKMRGRKCCPPFQKQQWEVLRLNMECKEKQNFL